MVQSDRCQKIVRCEENKAQSAARNGAYVLYVSTEQALQRSYPTHITIF